MNTISGSLGELVRLRQVVFDKEQLYTESRNMVKDEMAYKGLELTYFEALKIAWNEYNLTAAGVSALVAVAAKKIGVPIEAAAVAGMFTGAGTIFQFSYEVKLVDDGTLAKLAGMTVKNERERFSNLHKRRIAFMTAANDCKKLGTDIEDYLLSFNGSDLSQVLKNITGFKNKLADIESGARLSNPVRDLSTKEQTKMNGFNALLEARKFHTMGRKTSNDNPFLMDSDELLQRVTERASNQIVWLNEKVTNYSSKVKNLTTTNAGIAGTFSAFVALQLCMNSKSQMPLALATPVASFVGAGVFAMVQVYVLYRTEWGWRAEVYNEALKEMTKLKNEAEECRAANTDDEQKINQFQELREGVQKAIDKGNAEWNANFQKLVDRLV